MVKKYLRRYRIDLRMRLYNIDIFKILKNSNSHNCGSHGSASLVHNDQRFDRFSKRLTQMIVFIVKDQYYFRWSVVFTIQIKL